MKTQSISLQLPNTGIKSCPRLLHISNIDLFSNDKMKKVLKEEQQSANIAE